MENQEIIRSENYVDDYNVASIRNRIDLQPSGQIIKDSTPSDRARRALGTGLSVNYFAELRPGYEGVYDLVPDRFGNHTTGFSGIGISQFDGYRADRWSRDAQRVRLQAEAVQRCRGS